MQMLFAVAHLLGSILLAVIVGVGMNLGLAALNNRRVQRDAAEIAASLNLSVAELEEPRNLPRLLEHSSRHFSSELLRNRASDFVGVLLNILRWIAVALQITVVLAVVFQLVKGDLSFAPFAWFVLAIEIVNPIFNLIVGSLCYVLIGRFPGQAKTARKFLAKAFEVGGAQAVG